MSSTGNGQPGKYDVRMSVQIKGAVKEFHAQARAAGTNKHFLAALRKVIERLQKDPLVFGEPLYDLPALKLFVRQAVISPLVVIYGVHMEQALVFIRAFKVLG